MRPALIKRAGFAIFPEIQRWRSIGGALKPLSGKGESPALTPKIAPVGVPSEATAPQEIYLGVETPTTVALR